MSQREQPLQESDSRPELDSRWRHPGYRGTWRIDLVGRKWITMRSETVVMRGGAWATNRITLDAWPGRWEKA